MFWDNAMDVKSSPLERRKRVNSGFVGGRAMEEMSGEGQRGNRERTYRTSQTRPSVAVCFFVLSSLRTSS